MSAKDQQELVEKIKKLLVKKYGDSSLESMQKLFTAYDKDGDKRISAGELEQLLKDADVGNGFTRGAWVKGVIEALDKNADKTIDWNEFSDAVK